MPRVMVRFASAMPTPAGSGGGGVAGAGMVGGGGAGGLVPRAMRAAEIMEASAVTDGTRLRSSLARNAVAVVMGAPTE